GPVEAGSLPMKSGFDKNALSTSTRIDTSMSDDRLARVLVLIDEANAQDPNSEVWQGKSYPKELLYGMRMTEWLHRLYPEATDLLQIAARGQHIRRWEVPRQTYPDTREGYLRWRSYLYGFHADCVAKIGRAH